MIVVKIELWSAITGEKKELGRMHIANDGGGTLRNGNYDGKTFRGRSTEDLDKLAVQRLGRVEDYPREAIHVWNLVSRMLRAMGYK